MTETLLGTKDIIVKKAVRSLMKLTFLGWEVEIAVNKLTYMDRIIQIKTHVGKNKRI